GSTQALAPVATRPVFGSAYCALMLVIEAPVAMTPPGCGAASRRTGSPTETVRVPPAPSGCAAHAARTSAGAAPQSNARAARTVLDLRIGLSFPGSGACPYRGCNRRGKRPFRWSTAARCASPRKPSAIAPIEAAIRRRNRLRSEIDRDAVPDPVAVAGRRKRLRRLRGGRRRRRRLVAPVGGFAKALGAASRALRHA